MPTFAYTSFSQNKKKKKSPSGRKIGAVGDDKQLIFFTRPYHLFFSRFRFLSRGPSQRALFL